MADRLSRNIYWNIGIPNTHNILLASPVEAQILISLILYRLCLCSGTNLFDRCFNLQKLNFNVSWIIMLDTQEGGAFYLESHQVHRSDIACKTPL